MRQVPLLDDDVTSLPGKPDFCDAVAIKYYAGGKFFLVAILPADRGLGNDFAELLQRSFRCSDHE